MKHLVMTALLLLTPSCSMRTFYPTVGGVVGGAAGALGGPVTAAAGAGVGVLAGELAKGNEDLKQAKATIKAISKGDVEALVAAGMGKQKGFMDEALDTLYGFMKICLILLILWQLVPLAYARFIHKKQNGNPKKTEV